MPERTIDKKIDILYADLKAALADKGYTIVSEKPPNRILVKQGSLWGLSPKTAKKTVEFNLLSVDGGTQIRYSSKLRASWRNLTLIGCALSAVLVGLCLWMASDLSTFMVSQKTSFWSWLITVNGGVDEIVGQAFVGLTKALAIFLSIIIAVEFLIYFYVQSKIESVSSEIIRVLR